MAWPLWLLVNVLLSNLKSSSVTKVLTQVAYSVTELQSHLYFVRPSLNIQLSLSDFLSSLLPETTGKSGFQVEPK